MFKHRFFWLSRASRNVILLFFALTLIEGILWYFMPVYFESKLNSLFLVGVAIAAHPLALGETMSLFYTSLAFFGVAICSLWFLRKI